MIRNIQTGFISPQFHIVYDNKFETIMGGYDNNEAATNHIWDVLAPGEDGVQNIIHNSQGNQQTIPRLHDDWLSTEKKDTRQIQNLESDIR